jgi:L-lactate permease
LGNLWLSALAGGDPDPVLLRRARRVLRMKGHLAGTITVGLALLVAVFLYHMPATMALASALYGFCYGIWPIAWIILTAVFLYKVTVRTGQFEIIRASVVSLTEDQRLQMLLVGFAFGAFLEGAAGFGAPVAITAALLVGLGFNPLYAAGLCLITNTAPVAFGAMGIPVTVAGQVTGIDAFKIGQMAGRQLPLLSLIVPFWVIVVMDGRARRARDLARHSGDRRELRAHAVPDVQLHRTGAARHHVRPIEPDLPWRSFCASGSPSGSFAFPARK